MSEQYTRDFITLKQDRPGYGNMGREPSGRCIIEKKGDNAKVTVVAMGLNPQHYYKIYMINATGQSSNAVCIGNLKLDAKGKAEQRIEVDPNNIAGIPLADFNVFAIMVSGSSEPISPLVGYKKEELFWRNNFNEIDKNAKKEERNATQDDFFQGILNSDENEEAPQTQTSADPLNSQERIIPVPIVKPVIPVPGVGNPFLPERPIIETPIIETPVPGTPFIETPYIYPPGTILPEREIPIITEPIITQPIITEPIIRIPGVNKQSGDLGHEADYNQGELDEEFSEKESQREKFMEEENERHREGEVEMPDETDEEGKIHKQDLSNRQSSERLIQSIAAVLEPGLAEDGTEEEQEDENEDESEEEGTDEDDNEDAESFLAGSVQPKDGTELVSPWQDNTANTQPECNPEAVPKQSNEEKKRDRLDMHDTFLNMANKLNLHLKELEEHTNPPQAEPPTPHSEATVKNLEYIFLNNPVMKPFQTQRRPVKWVRITVKELALLNINHWKFMNHPAIISAEKKYNHLILGMIEDKTEDDKYGYYLGVPDKYSPDFKITAYRLGFIQFKSSDDNAPQAGDYGYWLMPV